MRELERGSVGGEGAPEPCDHVRLADAVHALQGSNIPVASVATGFPAGQTPLPQRIQEIEQAVEAGAKEIDVVIARNYVLTGGEIPAMVITDSVVRLLPGVLGGETSAEIESFVQDDKTIEAPQYTRPAEFQGVKVPDVLLSGNHAEINKWRKIN